MKKREADDNIYAEYRRGLIRLQQDTGKEYDKWILTLAGVAFGFSITLVKEFVRPSGLALQLPWLLCGSWFLFGLPVALIMLNLQLSYSASRAYCRIVDRRFSQYSVDDPVFWEETTKQIESVQRTRCVEFLNWIALFSFLLGILFLGLFVWCNAKMERHEQQQGTQPTSAADAARGKEDSRHRDATNSARADPKSAEAPAEERQVTEMKGATTMGRASNNSHNGNFSATPHTPRVVMPDQQRTATPHTPRVQPQTTQPGTIQPVQSQPAGNNVKK